MSRWALAAGLAACGAIITPSVAGASASAKLMALDGSAAGSANFRSTPHGVLVEISAHGLTPGPHAVLIHAKAACEAKTGFASAGPVFSLDTARAHGFFAKAGPRTGDLPVQFAAADGTLHASVFSTAFSLGDGVKSLFDHDGAALIIHAESDDYLSQPEGRAGARLICGSILRSSGPKDKKRRHS
ncbi:MAG: superoxide dismutase family protein [Rhizomicrobium sp.]|nr:superoxide dismutase family protein [Rhizomicrobium sp.]